MLKKIILLLLTICMTVCFCLTAQARSLSRAELYAALQEELHHYLDGDDAMALEDMVTQFMELGAYKKSVAFGLYASILRDVEAGDYSNLMRYTEILRLDEDFGKLLADGENPYPSVDEIEAYALGRQAQEAEDWASAVVYYERSIAVLDSMMRMTQIRMAGLAELPAPAATQVTNTPAPTPHVTATPAPTADPALYRKADFRTGSVVEFGHYEQDGRSSNGQEPIEWIVLDRSGNSAMLLARYALDSMAYHDGYSSVQVTWSECSLRTWLNNSFYYAAFSDRERDAISTTTVSTPWMPQYDTYLGPDTQDKVYLLSYQECQQYLSQWTVYPTQYAINWGVMVRNDVGGTTYWWLRSTNIYEKVSVMNSIGHLYGSRTNDEDGGVRPVIRVDLSNSIFQ